MSSGNYESQILEAIQILVDDAVSKAEYDKTIQGTISRCVDATIGKYIVRYQDSSFYAYSSNTDTTYPAGTGVYVLVPGNDMSKNKSIIGTVDHLGPDYVSIVEGENGYEVTGVNVIGADGTFGLCSYKENDITILYDRDNNIDLLGLDTFGFESYIKKSDSIICGATFKTALETEQKFRGDYGIIFNLDFIDKSTGEIITRSYAVNIDEMTGNPYNYTIAARQYGIFDVDGANFNSVRQIYLFAYNFPNTEENKPDDIFISKVELSAANALEKEAAATCALTFVTPKGIYFDEEDLDEDTRILQAQIRIKGNAIDNDSQNVEYYWFRENNGITSKSERYNQYGGSGWECLNNYTIVKDQTENNEAVVQWAKGNYQYTTKKADNVARETTYKCVAVYFDGTILSRTIVIYNYSSNYEISIKSDSGVAFNYDLGKPTLTCLVNGQEETSDAYSYVWSSINSSNQFSILEETATKNEEYNNAIIQRDVLLTKIEAEQILSAADQEKLSLYNQTIAQYEYIMRVEENKIYNLTISAITNFSTYKCSVYKSGIFIGTASIIITNREDAEANYVLTIDNGNQIFKYNENGISPANGSVKRPITVMPLGFTLYDDRGQKINHNVIKNIEWKVPSSDTLIEVSNAHTTPTENNDGTKSYLNTPELNFRIRETFNAAYDKNEIQLIITHNDKVISAKTNLTFVKEGENGTNGTDFVCKIVPNGIEGTITPQYPTIIYNEYTQQYELNYTPKTADKWFKVQLWHDGELIFEGTESGKTIENANAKVQWMMLQNNYSKDIKDNSNFTIDTETAAITFDSTEYENPANIVKCIINYNNVDYYATLPITIVRTINENFDIQLLDNSGFREVMYTTDGQSPAFDNQPFELTIFQLVDGIKNDISHFSSSEFAVDYNWEVKGSVYYSDWQLESNLIKNSLRSASDLRNQVSYKPIDTYNGLCVNNALVCNITRDGTKLASIHIPIHFYINRYGNAAMNGWDGNSIAIDEEGATILAPQIGAGSKNDDNTFTGVFMGSVKEPGAEKEEHGLFGYNAGQRTISLNSEDGSARFGKAGAGQIVIDPSTGEALLTSGNYDEDAGTGMEINLSEPSIKFGSGKFSIDKDGNVVADSFATRDQVEELEQSISYFTVSSNIDNILVPCDSNQRPLEDKDYVINFYGKFKGKDVADFSQEIEGSAIGISTKIESGRIIFTVDKTKVIPNAINEYKIKFTYTDLSNLADVKTYLVEKNVTIGLAMQGKGIQSIERYYLATETEKPVTIYNWDGNTEGKEVIENFFDFEPFDFYKYSNDIPTAEDFEGQYFIVKTINEAGEAEIVNGDIWDDFEIVGDKNNVLALKVGFIPFILVISESSDEYPQSPGIYLFSSEEGFVGEFSLKGEATSTDPNWTQTIPSLNSNNKYLWSYEKIIFTDGSETESKPVIISRYSADGKSAYQLWLDAGNTGTEEEYLESLKGADGQDGAPGETGNGIKSITKYYLAGKTYYSWDDSVVDNMAVIKYEMDNSRMGYSKQLDIIDDFDMLIGKEVEIKLYEFDSNNEVLEEQTSIYRIANIEWQWEPFSGYKIMVLSDNTNVELGFIIPEPSGDFTEPGIYFLCVYQQGTNAQGDFRAMKNYVSGINLPKAPEVTDERWTTEVQEVSEENPYLWTYENIQYTNDTEQNTDPVLISVYTESGKSAYELWLEAGNTGTEEEFLESLKGADGESGEDGIGVESIVKYYLAATKEDAYYTWDESVMDQDPILEKIDEEIPGEGVLEGYVKKLQYFKYLDAIFEPDDLVDKKGIMTMVIDSGEEKEEISGEFSLSYYEEDKSTESGAVYNFYSDAGAIVPWAVLITKTTNEFPYEPGLYFYSYTESDGETTLYSYMSRLDIETTPSIDNPRWSTEVQEIDKDYPYLWTYDNIKFTDGSEYNSTPVLMKSIDTEDSIISVETQYCIGTSVETPPEEDDEGWTTGLIISSVNLGDFLWTRTKHISKLGNVTYSDYSCIVYTQKELIGQETEYILSDDDNVQPAEDATYIYEQSFKTEKEYYNWNGNTESKDVALKRNYPIRDYLQVDAPVTLLAYEQARYIVDIPQGLYKLTFNDNPIEYSGDSGEVILSFVDNEIQLERNADSDFNSFVDPVIRINSDEKGFTIVNNTNGTITIPSIEMYPMSEDEINYLYPTKYEVAFSKDNPCIYNVSVPAGDYRLVWEEFKNLNLGTAPFSIKFKNNNITITRDIHTDILDCYISLTKPETEIEISVTDTYANYAICGLGLFKSFESVLIPTSEQLKFGPQPIKTAVLMEKIGVYKILWDEIEGADAILEIKTSASPDLEPHTINTFTITEDMKNAYSLVVDLEEPYVEYIFKTNGGNTSIKNFRVETSEDYLGASKTLVFTEENPTKTFDVYLTPGVYQFKSNMSESNITIEDENGSNTDYCQGLSRAAISFQDNNISYNYMIDINGFIDLKSPETKITIDFDINFGEKEMVLEDLKLYKVYNFEEEIELLDEPIELTDTYLNLDTPFTIDHHQSLNFNVNIPAGKYRLVYVPSEVIASDEEVDFAINTYVTVDYKYESGTKKTKFFGAGTILEFTETVTEFSLDNDSSYQFTFPSFKICALTDRTNWFDTLPRDLHVQVAGTANIWEIKNHLGGIKKGLYKLSWDSLTWGNPDLAEDSEYGVDFYPSSTTFYLQKWMENGHELYVHVESELYSFYLQKYSSKHEDLDVIFHNLKLVKISDLCRVGFAETVVAPYSATEVTSFQMITYIKSTNTESRGVYEISWSYIEAADPSLVTKGYFGVYGDNSSQYRVDFTEDMLYGGSFTISFQTANRFNFSVGNYSRSTSITVGGLSIKKVDESEVDYDYTPTPKYSSTISTDLPVGVYRIKTDGEDTKNALSTDRSSCLYIDSPDNKESGAYITYRDFREQNLSDYQTIIITKPNSNVRIQAISEAGITVSSIKVYKLKDENTNYMDFFGESVRAEYSEWEERYLASTDSVSIPSGYYQLTCDSVTGPEDLRLAMNFNNGSLGAFYFPESVADGFSLYLYFADSCSFINFYGTSSNINSLMTLNNLCLTRIGNISRMPVYDDIIIPANSNELLSDSAILNWRQQSYFKEEDSVEVEVTWDSISSITAANQLKMNLYSDETNIDLSIEPGMTSYTFALPTDETDLYIKLINNTNNDISIQGLRVRLKNDPLYDFYEQGRAFIATRMENYTEGFYKIADRTPNKDELLGKPIYYTSKVDGQLQKVGYTIDKTEEVIEGEGLLVAYAENTTNNDPVQILVVNADNPKYHSYSKGLYFKRKDVDENNFGYVSQLRMKEDEIVKTYETRTWSASKPALNMEKYPYLWTRLRCTYKYTGATIESIKEDYQDYRLDTSWNKLFDLTDELNAAVADIKNAIQSGYVRIENGTIMIGDEVENPDNLIIMNHKGIAFFSNSKAGTSGWPTSEYLDQYVTSTWSIDGILNMKDINTINLTASNIKNENLVLGNSNTNDADVTGDLDIYDKGGNLMFETDVDENRNFINGFKFYKYKANGETVIPNGYIYMSREYGFREYDASGKLIFGNDGFDNFASVANRTNQQIITNQLPDEEKTSEHYGIQMIPMKITAAGDNLVHIGIGFLKY